MCVRDDACPTFIWFTHKYLYVCMYIFFVYMRMHMLSEEQKKKRSLATDCKLFRFPFSFLVFSRSYRIFYYMGLDAENRSLWTKYIHIYVHILKWCSYLTNLNLSSSCSAYKINKTNTSIFRYIYFFRCTLFIVYLLFVSGKSNWPIFTINAVILVYISM